MSWNTLFPLNIIQKGDGKQSGFTKIKNELDRIYTIISGLFTENGHGHTGNGSDGAKINITDVTQNGTMHQPNPVSITSATGVLTLLETSNSFIANGTEAITSIVGWTSGIVMIRWNTSRTITHNASTLILPSGISRTTAIGDIGYYEITSTGAREVNYVYAQRNLVAEIVVSSAVTMINFPELNGNVDGGYVLISEIINTSSSTTVYNISFNSDENVANYLSQLLYANSTTVAANNTNKKYLTGLVSGQVVTSFANIDINSTGICTYTAQNVRSDGFGENVFGLKSTTETNITTITITASVSNSISVGSRFRLYRRK